MRPKLTVYGTPANKEYDSLLMRANATDKLKTSEVKGDRSTIVADGVTADIKSEEKTEYVQKRPCAMN